MNTLTRPAAPTTGADPAFAGYGHPTYTQVPNIFLDGQMTSLNLSETRVMLYLFRRTFGWQQEGATIRQSEFLTGRYNKKGEPVDQGVGVSDTSLALAVREDIALCFQAA